MDNHVMTRVREFDRLHGTPAQLNDWLYFPDGATREVNPQGALIDPPQNDFERLQNVYRYHQARLAEAVRQFTNLKEALALGSAIPDFSGLDELKRLQAKVQELNVEVERAKAAIAATPEGQRREEHRNRLAAEKSRQAEFKESLKAIRV